MPPHVTLLFIDIDFPDLMLKKREVVLQTQQLRELLGNDFRIGDLNRDRVLLRSERYCQIGCDLRHLDELRRTLETIIPLSDCDVLFVAEVSITYMETRFADELVQWASSLGQGKSCHCPTHRDPDAHHGVSAEFCLLEHLLPHGLGHPFAATMLSHLNKLKAPPKSVHQYPTRASQHTRFQNRGWRQVDAWDLWEVWSSESFLTSAERASLDEVEPFDEWEELMLFGRHYALVHASILAFSKDWHSRPKSTLEPAPDPIEEAIEGSLEVECHQNNTARRRFGEAVSVSNSMGRRFFVHMMGLGINGRADSADVYSLERQGGFPKLNLAGPLPRMCSTTTHLGEYGVLLAGGRGSPASPFSDCWLLQQGPECHWRPTWSLPIPLFRHAAVRLRDTFLALVVGGKTLNSRVSEECFVYDPENGWLRCRVEGSKPRSTFGAVLCNAPKPGSVEGTFHGLVAGGIGPDGLVTTDKHSWSLCS